MKTRSITSRLTTCCAVGAQGEVVLDANGDVPMAIVRLDGEIPNLDTIYLTFGGARTPLDRDAAVRARARRGGAQYRSPVSYLSCPFSTSLKTSKRKYAYEI